MMFLLEFCRSRWRVGLIVWAVGLAACTHKIPSQSEDQPQQAAPIFLWKVSHEQRKAPFYLYGTVHMNDPLSGRLDMALLEVLSESQQLILEVSPDEEENQEFRRQLWDMGLLPPEQNIMQVLSPATAAVLRKFFETHKIPKREQDAILRMRPWLASLSILYSSLRVAGASREFGSEEQLSSLARAQGKPILGLERASFQLELMAQASLAEQEYHLRQSLKEVDAFLGQGEESPEVHALFDAYRQGNLEKLAEYAESLANSAESHSFYQRFLVQRNQLMLDKIMSLLADESTLFIAVGALHLPGPEGLLQGLSARGFQWQRLPAKGRVQELYLPLD